MKYTSPIDPHVHLRGNEYEIDFIGLGFRDARAVGLSAVLEQPNPQPWLIDKDTIKNRIYQVKALQNGVHHGIHIGLTNDCNQVISALALVNNSYNGIVSDKTFYVHSTGNMGILDPDKQKWLWKVKQEIDYRGVSIGHFEAEDKFQRAFDPKYPISHSFRQNEESELVQVERQIRNAKDHKFQGIFYIAHLSSSATADYVVSERKNLPFKAVIESTFHHLFLNWEDYKIHGNKVKMNPPLRKVETQEGLFNHLLSGNIDVIGTDHAPHPIERKDDLENPASGIHALGFWPKGIELLREAGINEKLLEDVTFNNPNRIFNLNILPKKVDVEYDPSLWKAYGYNPFSRIDF